MASSSSSHMAASQDNTPLPLIPCPKCGNRVLTKIAVQGTRPGVRYYKCQLFSGGLCDFFEWREGYAGVLAAIRGAFAAAAPPAHVAAMQGAPANNIQDVGRVNLFVSLTNTMGVLLCIQLFSLIFAPYFLLRGGSEVSTG